MNPRIQSGFIHSFRCLQTVSSPPINALSNNFNISAEARWKRICKKVHIRFSDPNITIIDLKSCFSQFGAIKSAYICLSASKGNHRFGFVTFELAKSASKVAALRDV